MNILYHHRTKSRDGQAVHIRELMGALRARGHRVVEWALSPASATGETGRMGSEGGPLGRLAARVPRWAYEAAEHAYGPTVYRRLARAGKAMEADVLYERHALNNTAGVRASGQLCIPLLLEVNSPLTAERGTHERLVFRRWADRCERQVLVRAARVLVVTEVLGTMVTALGVPADRVHVIRNGVDLARYPEGDEPQREEIVVGFTGFFRPWHRLEDMVDALADGELSAATRLLLVGDGPSRTSVEARAATRGVAERVSVTGAVEREAIPDLVRSMDVCVQPAATPWASPLKLFEYMAAGRAIVAPDQPNIRELITDGVNGLLFDPREAGALGHCIARAVRDPVLRRKLGRGARSTLITERWTWEANAERVEQVAQSCLEEARR